MLIQFNFQNFKSFRDETSLDMSATKITEHSDSVFNVGKEKILPVAAIYGANASGKSKLFEALYYMHLYVIMSFGFGDDEMDLKEKKQPKITPFLFDSQSAKSDSSFEVYFFDDSGKFYNYGFRLSSNNDVEEEWLNSKTKTAREYKRIFYRGEQNLDLCGLPKKMHENIKISLGDKSLLVSLGAKLRVPELQSIRRWFSKNEFLDFGDPTENLLRSRIMPENFDTDNDLKRDIINYFNSFDENQIRSFKVERRVEDGSKGGFFEIETQHKIAGSEEFAAIPFVEESSGTLKMFAMYPDFQSVLKNGGVLFVDELNARLHPLLARSFIIAFLNPEINKNNAQLVFTTHDSWLLESKVLRRDEIWFTEKDKDGISHLYSLAEFEGENGTKIRNDENYAKNYLLGKYGAIPKLKNFRAGEEK